jgi:hypothetical protein
VNRTGREKLRSGAEAPSTLRRVPQRLRRGLGGILLLSAFLLPAACGGDDTGDVQALLDRAFARDISSADLRVDARVKVDGSGSLSRPLRIQATGPFRSNERKLPSVDLELRIGADGGGQTVQTGFLSTGDRAFVKFEDVYYEQPASEVRKANESFQRNPGREGSLRSLGLDPRSWLTDARERGEEKVAGTETVHVSGSLDVTAFLRDLNKFVERSRGAVGGATGQEVPPPLSEQNIEKAAEVVKKASFDVYAGKIDETIRRVSGRLELRVPEEDRAALGGLEGGTLEFSVEFADVNGDQKIEPPANARPFSELRRSLGSGALGGGGGVVPQPRSGDSGADADTFREYGECLEQAQPQDTEALQRCAQLLQQQP